MNQVFLFPSLHMQATLVKLFPNEAKKSNSGESLPSLPGELSLHQPLVHTSKTPHTTWACI